MWFVLKSYEKLKCIFSSTMCIHVNRAGMMMQMKNAGPVVIFYGQDIYSHIKWFLFHDN
jgi:hypothetical protein